MLNLSLCLGAVPSDWKKANIIPLYEKERAPTQLITYRPISLLPTLSIINNELVHKQLFKYLELNDTLTEAQSGFHSHYFTVIALKSVGDIFSVHGSKFIYRCDTYYPVKGPLTLLVILTYRN